jgi:hypothetical protein
MRGLLYALMFSFTLATVFGLLAAVALVTE